MFFDQLAPWQTLLLYGSLAISALVYTLLSKMAIGGLPLIRQRYRVMIALAFPFLLVVGLFLGVAALGVIATLFLVGGLLSLFGLRKRKEKPPRLRQFTIRLG